MPLDAHMTDRYSATRLVSLTNPDDSAATTLDSDRMDLAVEDVQAEFEIWAGVEYDDTDARHVTVGTECVVLKLRSYHQNEDPEALRQKRKELLQDLGRVTGRNRPIPVTDGVLEPSEEQGGIQDPRPYFDPERFRHYRPGDPGVGSTDTFPQE